MNVLGRIAGRNFVITDGYAYFSNYIYNGFYKVEIATGKTTFLGCFEDEKLSLRNIHNEIFLRDNKIYVCPYNGRHVHIWSLAEQTLYAAEIRAKDEKPFIIKDVILGEQCVFLVPDCKDVSVKKMDLESLKVSEISDKFEIQGVSLSASKDISQFLKLVEESHIEYAPRFWGNQASDKTWYGFIPDGRHMLCYRGEKAKPEIIPLEVVNKEKLVEHLHRVRMELLHGGLVFENALQLQDFLVEIEIGEIYKTDNRVTNGNIGKRIWQCVE